MPKRTVQIFFEVLKIRENPLKQSIGQTKFTRSVNYVIEIVHSGISDTMGTRACRINEISRNEARHANFEIDYFSR